MALETTAVATAGGFLLNGGEKKWIGNGSVGGTTVVWARAEDGQVHGYLVPQDSPGGYCATTIQGKSSLRAIWQAHIRLENVFVPAENVLPGANSFKDTTRCYLLPGSGGWPGPPSVMPRLLRDRRAVCGAARSIRPPLGRLADRSGTPGQNAVRTGHDAADSGPDDPSGRIGEPHSHAGVTGKIYVHPNCTLDRGQRPRPAWRQWHPPYQRVARHMADIEAIHTYEARRLFKR